MNQDMNQEQDEDGGHDRPQTNSMVRRGFDGVAMAGENAATQALVAKATADIQARWVMAMRRPRQMHDVRSLIIKECQRPEFAKEAMYVVPRGDAKITGLSIRYAEVAMRCMGNMSCEAQTLFDSDEERVIRVTATDYETNASWHRDITVKKTVERKFLKRGQRSLRERINSYGDRIFVVEASDDEVATKEAAMISKSARTAILRLVPGNIQSESERILVDTVKKSDAKDPDAAKNEIFDGFAKLNIMPSDLESWLGHAIDRVTPHEITELRNLWTAVRDGEISWEEALESADAARKKGERVHAPPPKAVNGAAAANGNGTATAPQPAASSPPKSQAKSGKGTAAAKEALRKDEHPNAPPPAEVAKDDPEAEPAWMKEGKHLCPKCGIVPCTPPGICANCAKGG